MMADIHNHILFGIDDGAKTPDDSIQIASQAVWNGITHIIATPHYKRGSFYNPSGKILKRVAEVNQLLSMQSIPLTVLPGMEITFYKDLANDLRNVNSDLLTLNNTKKYILIELPKAYIPPETEMVFYEMQLSGVVPIIAHPERNEVFREQPNKLYSFIQKGSLAQITAGSLNGLFGKEIQKFSLKLLKHYLVHFVASDAHGVNRRAANLPAAYKYIKRRFSASYTAYLQENAVKVIKGEDFTVPQPVRF